VKLIFSGLISQELERPAGQAGGPCARRLSLYRCASPESMVASPESMVAPPSPPVCPTHPRRAAARGRSSPASLRSDPSCCGGAVTGTSRRGYRGRGGADAVYICSCGSSLGVLGWGWAAELLQVVRLVLKTGQTCLTWPSCCVQAKSCCGGTHPCPRHSRVGWEIARRAVAEGFLNHALAPRMASAEG